MTVNKMTNTKSTKCPTCGSECEIEGTTTKYYVPKTHSISDEEINKMLQDEYENYSGHRLINGEENK